MSRLTSEPKLYTSIIMTILYSNIDEYCSIFKKLVTIIIQVMIII